LAGAIKLYFKIEIGDQRADVSDPLHPINPPTSNDTLYTGPFELTNHASGKTVKVIAMLPGRTNSYVTAF